MDSRPLFKSYRQFLKELLPGRSARSEVRKISIHGGMTCPNLDGSKGWGGCTYCNNRGFAPSFSQADIEIYQQIDQGILNLPARFFGCDLLAYFQPYSNTYAPVEYLERIYREAMNHPRVKGLVIGTRPDCLPLDVEKLLKKIAEEIPVVLELGLQTCNEETSKRIRRGHSWNDFANAMDHFSNSNLRLGVHVILGLPGESQEHFRDTARSLQQWKIDTVKIHPLHIVEGTVMANQYRHGEIDMLTQTEYSEAVAEFLAHTRAEVAIERFTGDSPSALHLAPEWSGCRQQIVAEVESIMKERGWTQGCLAKRFD